MRAASTIFAPGPGPTMTMRNYFRGGGRGGGGGGAGGGGGGGNGGGARGGGSGGARAAAAASAETVQNDEDEEDDWSTPVSDDVQACADEPVWWVACTQKRPPDMGEPDLEADGFCKLQAPDLHAGTDVWCYAPGKVRRRVRSRE